MRSLAVVIFAILSTHVYFRTTDFLLSMMPKTAWCYLIQNLCATYCCSKAHLPHVEHFICLDAADDAITEKNCRCEIL